MTDRQEPKRINFTVASALFKELGERLVGKPHIALAELIKNAYDADASKVTIEFGKDRITITDNGHGMTAFDFERFWMQIGTPHKQAERTSPALGRPLTGSKGVGRLSVQFLAKKVEITTSAKQDTPLIANVDWQAATRRKLLTDATAAITLPNVTPKFTNSSKYGTRIVLTELNQKWDAESLKALAQEIWLLQPPEILTTGGRNKKTEKSDFEIDLVSSDKSIEEEFNRQIQAIDRNWIARIDGNLVPGKSPAEPLEAEMVLRYTDRRVGVLQFDDREPVRRKFLVPHAKQGDLRQASFKIYIFNLLGRQPDGIKIDDMRKYFKIFGGVHVYDTGFRLPYYGAETDWLNFERDHSHRKVTSDLLPPNLQEARGLNDLPTNSRIIGAVSIDTGKELGERTPGYQPLTIQVTRDRLVDNNAYRALKNFARWTLDFYATETARRKYAHEARQEKTRGTSTDKVVELRQQLEKIEPHIADDIYINLERQLRELEETRASETALEKQRVGLLGALATAGISAIAYEHEAAKQLSVVEGIAKRLGRLRTGDINIDNRLSALCVELQAYVVRATETRALFSNLMEEDNRNVRDRMPAGVALEMTIEQMQVLLRGVEVEFEDMDDDILLPVGSFAEWSAIFQNVLVNATNAMLDSQDRRIMATMRSRGSERWLLVSDTGSGIDVADSESLFAAFERRKTVSKRREDLVYGGTGIGLTIVRMIAGSLGCDTDFIEPVDGYSTTFRLRWRELGKFK